MLPLSVSRVFHLVPQCPEMVSTRHGWRHEELGSCPLLLVSPQDPSCQHWRAPQFHSWKDLALHPLFSLGSYFCLGLIFVADGLQVGKTNFLPRRKIQFDISSYHSLHIGLLNKYKCKTSSHAWSWSLKFILLVMVLKHRRVSRFSLSPSVAIRSTLGDQL